MKKYFLALVFFFHVANAFADAPLIWKGTIGSFLTKDGWELKSGEKYLHLYSNPTAGAGLQAPVGSLGVFGPTIFVKTGAAATQWLDLLDSITGVPSGRTISTTAPLLGGGDLTANRTLSIPAATSSVDGYMPATRIVELAAATSTNASQGTTLSDHETRITNNTSSINGHTTQLADHETRITTATNKNNSQDTLLGTHTTQIADHETRITNNTTTIGNHTTQLADHETRITTATTKNNSQDTTLTDHETRITTATTKNNSQDTTLTNHEGRIAAEETATATQLAYNGTNNTKNTAQDGRLSALETAPAADTSSTKKLISQTAHAFTVGTLVRQNGTTYVKTLADTDANAEVYGMVSMVPDANSFWLTTEGYVSGLTGLTAGTTYFASGTTAGTFTATVPSTATQVSKPVLNADSATSGYLIQSRGLVVPVPTPVPANGQVVTGNSFTASGLDVTDLAHADMQRASLHANAASGIASFFIKALDGTAISASNTAKIAFRRNNSIDGSQITRTLTSQPQLDIPVGTTLGAASLTPTIYAYAIDNAGTVELALSARQIPETSLVSTLALTAGVSDATALYSATARTNVAVKFLGKASYTLTTLANYLTPAEVSSSAIRNVAAQINMNAQWVGQMKVTGCSGQWSLSSTTPVDFSIPTGCVYTVTPGSLGIAAPSANYPGLALTPEKDSQYVLDFIGTHQVQGTNGATYVLYDATNNAYSKEEQRVFSASSQVGAPISKYTYQGASTSTVQLRVRGYLDATASSTMYMNGLTAPNTLTINVYKFPKASSIAGSVITKDPVTKMAGLLTTRVTGRAPNIIGEYRYLGRAANAHTYSDLAPPPVSISAANGFPIWRGGAFSAADTSPSRIDLFIGALPIYKLEAYAQNSGARGDSLDTTPWGTSAEDYGLVQNYDPSTGVLSIYRSATFSAAGAHYLGRVKEINYSSTSYAFLDLNFFSNPLAAGLTESEDLISLDTYAGYGSTNTKVPYFTNTLVKGSALTLTSNSATLGAMVTVNRKGLYCTSFNQEGPVANYAWNAIMKNAVGQYSTTASTVSNTFRKAAASTPTVSGGTGQPLAAYCDIYSVGDVINPQTDGLVPATAARSSFSIAKMPSPLETVGAVGGVQEYSAKALMTSNYGTTVGVPIIFQSLEWDTGGIYNAATGQFKAPVSGHYDMGCAGWYPTASASHRVYKNGSAYGFLSSGSSSQATAGSMGVNAAAGDLFTIVPDVATTITNQGAGLNFNCTFKKIN